MFGPRDDAIGGFEPLGPRQKIGLGDGPMALEDVAKRPQPSVAQSTGPRVNL
jgi:hypothetical protein